MTLKLQPLSCWELLSIAMNVVLGIGWTILGLMLIGVICDRVTL